MKKSWRRIVMMSELHPVTQQLQPLFDSTPIDAVAAEVCKRVLDEYIRGIIFYENEDFVETLNTLYSLNDKKTYSILEIETNSGYTYFLMPCTQGLRQVIFHAGSRYLKQSGKYSGKALGVEMRKVSALAELIVEAVTKSLTYMKRSATGIKEEVVVEYPPVEKLQLFYECERKIAYESLMKAGAELWDGNKAYLCSHCKQYHQGRTPKEEDEAVEDSTYLKRYQRVWRYSHHLGEFRHKAETLS